MSLRFFIFSLLLLAVNLFCGTGALAESILQTISRTDETTALQLHFRFDTLPGSTLTTNGRRVDLELAQTLIGRGLSLPETDDRMIKMVPKELPSKTIVSIYFRYPPQRVTITRLQETGVLLLDVLLGNQLSTSYPELTTKLQGVSVIKRSSSDSLNPVNISDYAKNWPSFFTAYELPVVITAPPLLHLPPFPLAAAVSPQTPLGQWLPAEIQQAAREKKWTQACLLLRDEINRQPKEQFKERLVLSYAEALLRAGEYREPYFLLQRIMIHYPESVLSSLAHLLFLYQQASRGDYINSYFEMLPVLDNLQAHSPFADDLHLLKAEMALMAHQDEEAEKLLIDPVFSRNGTLAPLRQLRLADLWSTQGKHGKALTAYTELARTSDIMQSDPMSLAFFSDCLYLAKHYPEAAKAYLQLDNLLNNQPSQDLVLYRLALCQLHMRATEKKARIDLDQILDAFPQTEGGIRALIKRTDLDYLAKKLSPDEALEVYARFAREGKSILQREECLFKQALVNALAAEHETSVRQCMRLLREYQDGNLRTEAMALLIQQLPDVINRLVANKEYVRALVLAKQNKNFFVRGWLKPNLLYDLAEAYARIGMVDQAAQTYQYLFEISDNDDKEKIYLPMLHTLLAAGRYLRVEEYADRYQLRYPKGKDAPEIFLLKALALSRSGHFDQSLKLLTAKSAPNTLQVKLLKGRLFHETKQWQQVIDTLDRPELKDRLEENQLLLPLAEALFQTGRDDKAQLLFQGLAEKDEENEQVRFRLAQIESRQGNRQQALKLFRQLAEKGKDSLWKKLAHEEASILEIAP
jgi:tetratricopeptide (TPR) repeat protein